MSNMKKPWLPRVQLFKKFVPSCVGGGGDGGGIHVSNQAIYSPFSRDTLEAILSHYHNPAFTFSLSSTPNYLHGSLIVRLPVNSVGLLTFSSWLDILSLIGHSSVDCNLTSMASHLSVCLTWCRSSGFVSLCYVLFSLPFPCFLCSVPLLFSVFLSCHSS